jgi:hypothetical protein
MAFSYTSEFQQLIEMIQFLSYSEKEIIFVLFFSIGLVNCGSVVKYLFQEIFLDDLLHFISSIFLKYGDLPFRFFSLIFQDDVKQGKSFYHFFTQMNGFDFLSEIDYERTLILQNIA